MLSLQEIKNLHSLQRQLALKRDWIAVAHLQALIDHVLADHSFCPVNDKSGEPDLVVH